MRLSFAFDRDAYSAYDGRMVRFSVHLPDKALANLKWLSKRSGLSIAELIRRMLDTYIQEEKRAAKIEREGLKS